MSEEMNSSKVHRKLDSRIKILWMDLEDLLIVLIFAAVMNLFFGQTRLSTVMVFILPGILEISLFLIKRNHPKDFFVHFLKFHMSPGIFLAGEPGIFEEKRRLKIYE